MVFRPGSLEDRCRQYHIDSRAVKLELARLAVIGQSLIRELEQEIGVVSAEVSEMRAEAGFDDQPAICEKESDGE